MTERKNDGEERTYGERKTSREVDRGGRTQEDRIKRKQEDTCPDTLRET